MALSKAFYGVGSCYYFAEEAGWKGYHVLRGHLLYAQIQNLTSHVTLQILLADHLTAVILTYIFLSFRHVLVFIIFLFHSPDQPWPTTPRNRYLGHPVRQTSCQIVLH